MMELPGVPLKSTFLMGAMLKVNGEIVVQDAVEVMKYTCTLYISSYYYDLNMYVFN